MLSGRLLGRLSVVTSAQVTWKPVLGGAGRAPAICQEKWPVTLASWMAKDAERFSGLASTLGRTGPAAVRGGKVGQAPGDGAGAAPVWVPGAGQPVCRAGRSYETSVVPHSNFGPSALLCVAAG